MKEKTDLQILKICAILIVITIRTAMKKPTITMVALLAFGSAQADYTLKIPMEQRQGQGGALSNGSIIFYNGTLPVEPLLGEWIDKGSPTGYTAWTPLPDTVSKDQPFEQLSTCSQEQTRTVEEQVKNLDTGIISKTTGINLKNHKLSV